MNALLKLVVGFSVLVTIAAVDEGEGDLLKMFANERKEMRADFRRENDEQNQVIAELHQGIAEQKKENAEQKEEIVEQKKEIVEQKKAIAEQKEEIKKLHKKLHQADLKNEKATRQRDQKETKEMETKISNALRQERNSSDLEHVVESVMKKSILRSSSSSSSSGLEVELKQLIDGQINNYLINQRICVGGTYRTSKENQHDTQTVSFGYNFPRKPTVSASLAHIYNNAGDQIYMQVEVSSITTTSATITYRAYYGPGTELKFSWLACL